MFEFVDLMACIASQVKEDNQLLLLIHDDVVHMQTNEGKELLLKKREDIGLIALANLMTNPAVVYLSLLTKALRPGLYPAAAAVTELLAVLAEGYAYKRRAAKIARPMLFSLCMNALSFGTGLVIKLIF